MIKRYFAKILWDFCECFGISLGRLAPHVYAAMIGCKEYMHVDDFHKVMKLPTGYKPDLIITDEYTSLQEEQDRKITETGIVQDFDRDIIQDFENFASQQDWQINVYHNVKGIYGDYKIISMVYEDDVHRQSSSQTCIDYFIYAVYENIGTVYSKEEIEMLRNKYKEKGIKT